MPHTLRIGVDTGSHFADLVAVYPDGRLRAMKVTSTPADPAQAVLQGLATLLPERGGIEEIEIIHGTTVATDALLVGPVALVTTQGFRDLLLLGRQTRPDLYALNPQPAPPPCREEDCLEVDERINALGEVLRAPDPSALDRLREHLAARRVVAVAVVLLNSGQNDAHERAVAEALAPLGLPVSLSSVVLPEAGEYERAVATVAAAHVAPALRTYLGAFEAALLSWVSDVPARLRLRIMQATGHAVSITESASVPVRTPLSGAVAGLLGAQAVANEHGITRLITLDMGGTSTEVALIERARADGADGCAVGLPFQLSMPDVRTIGVGSGAVVYVDSGGTIRVGSAAAGSDPGPSGGGAGRRLPTLAEAGLLLGRLRSGGPGEGGATRSEAAAAFSEVAARLGCSAQEAAAAGWQVAVAAVARAIRGVLAEHGHEPREWILLPHGGAGPVLAVEVAQELGISRVLVPPAPGVLSAYGALCAQDRRGGPSAQQIPAVSLAPLSRQTSSRDDRVPFDEVMMTFFVSDGGPLRDWRAPVLDRAAWPAAPMLLGPALVVEYSSTTVLPPGWQAQVTEHGALLLQQLP